MIRFSEEAKKKIIEDYKYLKSSDFLIIVSLIGMSFALIFYQLMTINAKFIFFIIPILVGFSHIYYKKYLLVIYFGFKHFQYNRIHSHVAFRHFHGSFLNIH